MRSRPRSASTAWTVRFWVVCRTAPMRPAIRTPLKTRLGVAQAPIEPGERCLRCVPCAAPRPLKPCRFMTPAVPLPLVRPTTSTFCPASKTSAVTSWPGVYSPASEVRISARKRRGVTPAFSKWPASGLFTLRGAMAPKAGWAGAEPAPAPLRDHARPGLDHGHRDEPAGPVPDLGHAELLAQHALHLSLDSHDSS